MPGYGTNFIGPVIVGTRPQGSPTTPAVDDSGMVVCEQSATFTASGAVAQQDLLYVPIGAKIIDIIADTTTAWNGSTAPLTIGASAYGGTDYMPSTAVLSAGRVRPTFTGAQLGNMANVAAPGSLYVQVAPTGSNTAGSTTVTIVYAVTVQPFVGNT